MVFSRVAELCEDKYGKYLEFLFDGDSIEQELVVQVFLPSYVSVFGQVARYGPPVPYYGAERHQFRWEPEAERLLIGAQVYAPGKYGSWGHTSAEDMDVLEDGSVTVQILYDVI